MKQFKHGGVCLWNIAGYRQRSRTFFNFLREFKPKIVFLTETHLQWNQKLSYIDYHVIQKNRSEASKSWGGVAILISHDFKYKVEPITDLATELELVAIRILRPGQRNLHAYYTYLVVIV